jgi:hypothetical protein
VLHLTSADLVPLAFIVAGSGAIAYGAWILWQAWGSTSWPTASGTITVSEISSGLSDGFTMYQPRIEYQYAVGGRTYTSDRLVFGGPVSTSWQSPAAAIVARYPTGSHCRVAYDPSAPELAVLESGSKWYHFVTPLFGAGILGYGLSHFIAR